MQRVQIPAYTDRWMMGDRFGEITKIITRKIGDWKNLPRGYKQGDDIEIAYVKLDKSGKTFCFFLTDCEVI